MIKYKYSLDDFEVIRTHGTIPKQNDNSIMPKFETVEVYELYLKSNYFKVGDWFGLLKGTLYRGTPQTRLRTKQEVKEYLGIETGACSVNLNVFLDIEHVEAKE